MEVELDGNEIRSIEEFHDKLKIILELPDYYGRNLDALWDCLTAWVDRPHRLVWKNFENSRLYMGEYADKALELFVEAEKEMPRVSPIVGKIKKLPPWQILITHEL